MSSEVEVYPLRLRHPFGISRGTDAELPTVLLTLGDGAVGEGPPVRYLGQSAESTAQWLRDRLALLESLQDPEESWTQLAREDSHDEHTAARAAVDAALWDRAARRAELPLWQFLGMPDPAGLQSSFTIALDTPEVMERKAREAAAFPILKVKLGRGEAEDRASLGAVRRGAPGTRLLVDANAGWSLPVALRMVRWLADQGVELVEQPLPIGAEKQLPALRRESPIPLFLDESVQALSDLPTLRGMTDGINIKLAKCGGITEARRMMDYARSEGWQIYLGCMIESSLGIAAGVHLAGGCDWRDLDGALLTANDPYIREDFPVEGEAHWVLNPGAGHGLGVRRREAQENPHGT